MLKGGRVVKIAVAAIILATLIFSSLYIGAGRTRKFFIDIVGPYLRLSQGAREILFETSEKNIPSETYIKALEFELGRLREENLELKSVLDFRERSGLPLIGARVILYHKERGREFLLLDQGEETGIRSGSYALDENQIFLGVVSETGEGFSKVNIASNPGNTFEAEIPNIGLKILAKGIGARTLALNLVPQDALLRRGDRLTVVQGSRDRTFLAGIVAGEGEGVAGAFKEASAVLLANPPKTKNVYILNP